MLNSPLQVGMLLGLLGILAELIGALAKPKIIRSAGYFGSLPLTAFASTTLLAHDLTLTTFLFAYVAVFRIINAFRQLSGRQHEHRTQRVTRQTSVVLIFLQVLTLVIWWITLTYDITVQQWITWLLASALIISISFVFVVRRNLNKTHLRTSDKYTENMKLPSVSVCIPARNETNDLPACLNSILASEYPKLEVLVLDDCSQDKTSEVIKKFAQKGVRFISGEEPKKGWLAKNQAYQQLSEAATGEILIFCGVDIRFGQHDIYTLVSALEVRNKQMISILPKGLQINEHAGLLQPMRYWWELALPRRMINRPPVLSSCWLIRKDALTALGGLKAVDNTVIPEGYFARELATTDGYSFIRSDKKLAVSTVKQFDEQWQTAVRLRYPQLRKRPEMVLLTSLAVIWFHLMPVGMFILGFITKLGLLWTLAGLATLGLLLAHYMIIKAWGLKEFALPLLAFPAAVVMELVVLHYSMWRYEFSTVAWKDRNICIPVMQTYKRLPPA